ncbi:transglutaminase family protein, partial [Flavobacterium sp. 9AF]|uniref:transglutaminase-like domain-containing protein n=1 Tax=Flavobacterium sp. 9AF TaxID=2653142 RepID=UPI001356ED3D
MRKNALLVVFFISINIWSQKNIEPSPTDIKTAKELREKFDKSDIAILKSTEKVNFEIAKDKKNVEVNYAISEVLLNINHRADIQKYEFYDSQSLINTFSLKYKNNKPANIYARDEFYKSNDLFYNDARVKYFNIDFPIQGYTYLYDIEKKINDVKYFTSIYFNDEFPVIDKEIIITVPKWLTLEIKEFNFEGFDITKTEVKNTESTIFKYTIKNIPPSKKEKLAPGPSYIYPHILFIAKSFENKNEKTILFNKTADLYKWYKSLIDSMDDDPTIFENKVKELTQNAKNDEEKIKQIYYWVQDNIRYIAFEDGIAGFKPDDSQNVFNKRYGDCKGMANLTKQMLKLAGFDARLCWIGTKHIAYNYSIPSLSVDNHMICALIKDGKKYYLDGTEKYNSFKEYAERIQGKEVLIENGNDFIIDKIPSQKAVSNKDVYTVNYTIEGETLKGKVNKEYSGESRASFLYNYNTIKNDKKEEALKWYINSGNKNYIVNNIITSDLTNRDQNVKLSYDVSLENHVSSFDNEMYIDLD